MLQGPRAVRCRNVRRKSLSGVMANRVIYVRRSVSVSLECGDEEVLYSVDEPSTCVYVMTVRSPLACTAQVLAKAENEVALIKARH